MKELRQELTALLYDEIDRMRWRSWRESRKRRVGIG